MSTIKHRFIKGIILAPDTVALDNLEGEIKVDSSDGKIKVYLKDGVNPSAAREIVTNSQTQTLTNKTIDVDNNTVSNIVTGNLKAGVLNTSTTLASASNTQLPSALAVKTYVDNSVASKDQASEISYSNVTSSLTATNVQNAVDEIDNNVDNLVSLSGVALDSTTLGTFTGTTIPDNRTVKEAFQSLETAVELKLDEIGTSTDNALVRWDGTAGSAVQNSTATLSDTGTFTLTGQMNVDNLRLDGNTILSTNTNGNLTLDANGAGNIILNDDVIVQSNVSYVSSDNSQTGANVELTLPTTSFVRLVGVGLTSVDMIVPGADEPGSRVIFTNDTGGTVIFNNLTGATANNQILTGNGLPYELLDGSSIELIYDATSLKWKMLGVSTQVDGPTTSTDNRVVRWDGTSGKIIQESGVTIDDSNIMTGLAGISSSGSATFSGALNTTSTTTSTATGSSAVITSATASVIRLTSATLVSIGGYAATTNGRRTTLINNTGNPITVNNEDAAVTATNRIVTGTNGNVTIQNLGSFELIYNSSTGRHHMIAGAGSGGGVGGINYIDNYDFEGDTNLVIPQSWIGYNDGTGNLSPIDGTGGTLNGSFTFVATTTTPLRGTKSALITRASTATNLQGHGVSTDFTIDAADQAQVLRISFDYSVTGTYSDGAIRVYVYDVTNSRLIEVVDRDLYASTQGKFVGTFQTSPDSTSYRLILHVADTSVSSLWTVEIDNVIVGPQTIVKGAIVTDWEPCTITWSGIPGTVTSFIRRVGDSADIKTAIAVTGASTGTISFSVPAGLSVDTAKLLLNEFQANLRMRDQTGSTASYTGVVSYNGGTFQIAVNRDTVNAGTSYISVVNASAATPVTWASGDFIEAIVFGVPIQGWSSNVVLSEDAGNREIVVFGQTPGSAAVITANTTDIPFVEVRDSSSSWNGTIFIAPETGIYDLSGMVATDAATAGTQAIMAYINTGLPSARIVYVFIPPTGATTRYKQFNGRLDLAKGDTVSLRADGNLTLSNTSTHYFSIAKRSSPQTIAASEVVALRATTITALPIGTTATDVKFDDITLDTHNAYDATTGIFIAPQTGYYQVNVSTRIAATALTTAQFILLQIVSSTITETRNITYGNGATVQYEVIGSCVAFLSKGQQINIRLQSSVATTLNTTGGYNALSICKISGVS